MTILITGATGFVMSGLVRHLAEHGHAGVAADLPPPDAALRSHLSGLAGGVTFRQVDVTDAKAVRALVADVRAERIVHGAAITAIPAEAERDGSSRRHRSTCSARCISSTPSVTSVRAGSS
jgi:nucleoside-diphosphate-sugar epimerase